MDLSGASPSSNGAPVRSTRRKIAPPTAAEPECNVSLSCPPSSCAKGGVSIGRCMIQRNMEFADAGRRFPSSCVDDRYLCCVNETDRCTHMLRRWSQVGSPARGQSLMNLYRDGGSPSLRKTEDPNSEEATQGRSPSEVTTTSPSLANPRLAGSAFLAYVIANGPTPPLVESILHHSKGALQRCSCTQHRRRASVPPVSLADFSVVGDI